MPPPNDCLSTTTSRSTVLDGMATIVRGQGTPTISQHLAYVERLVAAGGPELDEYEEFRQWLAHVAKEIRAGRLSAGELRAIREAFGRALSLETNQGLSLRKPHGYTGDYEIIDRIYREHVTDDPALRNWDLYFQAQAGPRAVRHRKAYFVSLAEAAVRASGGGPLHILDVASGPGRDVAEFLARGFHCVTVECVDTDPNAIAYARGLCRPFLDRVSFKEANALRYSTDKRFGLVWSAGLFDYFGDKGFKFVLGRLLDTLDNDGELVVGNFSTRNSSRDYMEVVGDWPLFYRSAEDLHRLARECGVAAEDVRVGEEPTGVNLFLHVKRGARFLETKAPGPS